MKKHLAILFAALLLGGCGDSCENQISQSVISPSGATKAVVFNRGCGATVGFNTQVSILPSHQPLPGDAGNVLILDGSVPLQLRWDSDRTINISGVSGTRVFKQETSLNEVRIGYAR